MAGRGDRERDHGPAAARPNDPVHRSPPIKATPAAAWSERAPSPVPGHRHAADRWRIHPAGFAQGGFPPVRDALRGGSANPDGEQRELSARKRIPAEGGRTGQFPFRAALQAPAFAARSAGGRAGSCPPPIHFLSPGEPRDLRSPRHACPRRPGRRLPLPCPVGRRGAGAARSRLPGQDDVGCREPPVHGLM